MTGSHRTLGLVLARISLTALLVGCTEAPRGSLAGTSFAPGAAEGTARSLLLLTLDTTRPDHLAPYGATGSETPQLQALARAGAVFERAYAATPVTLPSHATLLTGLDPPGHGVRNNGTHFLPAGIPTLATLLDERGFATAAFVSAAVLEARYGLARGFAIYDDDLSAGRPKELRMIAERPAEVTVDSALAWLDGLPSGRFLLWVHLFDPHAAYQPPSPWAERFADRPYDGEIAYMDAQIGRLLEHPRIADPATLVMAVGDHGESLGEHGEASHAMLAYDATLRIPWIVRGPGVPPGKRVEREVGQIDLLPTALGLLGLAAGAADLPGLDLASDLRGDRAGPETEDRRELYAETFVAFFTYGWAKLRTLRRDGWKYIEAPTPELYHVAEDPGEIENLFGREPARAQTLASRLEDITAADGETSSAIRPLDRETRDKLRSLGYLAGGSAASGGSDADLPNDRRPDPKAMIDLHRALDRAEHHLYAREFERAITELRAVLARDRTNRTALVDLAKALGELGRYDEAIEAAGRALSRWTEDPELHLTVAGLESARGRPDRALDALDTALALDPRLLDAKVEKARLLLLRGEPSTTSPPQAVTLLEEVLAEDPDHARAEVVWAEKVEAGRGEIDAAEVRLRGVTAREPFLAEGWQALGRVLERAGRPEDAEAAYRDGLDRQPRDPALQALLGLLLAERGEVEEATRHLQAADRSSPAPRAEVHDGLAAVAVAKADWSRAEAEARRALELDPALASAWNHLAVALEEQGKRSAALEAYARADGTDPGYWPAAFNRGLLLRKLGRQEEAMAAFRQVLARNPEHAASLYELGVLHGARGESAAARKNLEAALAAEPEHPRNEQIRRLLAALGRGS